MSENFYEITKSILSGQEQKALKTPVVLKEEDEKPADKYAGWSSHTHKHQASYHRREANRIRAKVGVGDKKYWEDEHYKYHSGQESHHLYHARNKQEKEKKAQRLDKKLHGAERAPYQTGHDVHHASGGRFGTTTRYKYGKVIKHKADDFHVKWEDGSESHHRQSDGHEVGSGRRTGFSIYRSSGVSRTHEGNEAHKAKHAEHEAKKKAEAEHQARIQRAKDNLASHHHSDITKEHLEAMEALHHKIMTHKASKD